MKAKTCNHCKELKSHESFNWRYKQLGERQKTCKTCQNKQKARWYQKNKARHKANMYENKLNNVKVAREFIWIYFKTHPCVDCGESDPIVLEFDHITGTKRNTVMKMVADGYSINTIKKEIGKCVVRCANCHKRKTYKDTWRDRS